MQLWYLEATEVIFRAKLAIDNGFTHDTKYLYNLSGWFHESCCSSSLKDGKECVITSFSQKSLYKLTDTFYFITKKPDSYVCANEGPLRVGKIVLSAVQVSKGYLEPGKELKYFSSYSSSVHLHLSSSVRSLQQVDLALFVITLMGSHRVPHLPGLESGGLIRDSCPVPHTLDMDRITGITTSRARRDSRVSLGPPGSTKTPYMETKPNPATISVIAEISNRSVRVYLQGSLVSL